MGKVDDWPRDVGQSSHEPAGESHMARAQVPIGKLHCQDVLDHSRSKDMNSWPDIDEVWRIFLC